MAMYTETPENAHKSREYHLESALYDAMQTIQQMQIAINTGNTALLQSWQRHASKIVLHWMDNTPDYMQAPEWNEATD